jgi:hypothetical protein
MAARFVDIAQWPYSLPYITVWSLWTSARAQPRNQHASVGIWTVRLIRLGFELNPVMGIFSGLLSTSMPGLRDRVQVSEADRARTLFSDATAGLTANISRTIGLIQDARRPHILLGQCHV